MSIRLSRRRRKAFDPALERAQGYLKLPNGRALTGQSHDYRRHGTTTLFAALEVATGAAFLQNRLFGSQLVPRYRPLPTEFFTDDQLHLAAQKLSWSHIHRVSRHRGPEGGTLPRLRRPDGRHGPMAAFLAGVTHNTASP